jgi:hypothetical protein
MTPNTPIRQTVKKLRFLPFGDFLHWALKA